MQGTLRITVPIHSLEPGGVERVALGLAEEWQRLGHQVTMVLGRSGCRNLCSAPPLDFWRIPTRLPTAPCETLWLIYSLHRYLLENRTDVLFCPGNTYAVVAAGLRLLHGVHVPPMLLKVSNALRRPDMPSLMRRGYDVWLRIQGSLFDRMVGLSPAMQREICETALVPPNRVPVIANPVVTRRRLNHLRHIERRPGSAWGTRYLAAGRLVRQKNYPLLLRAFARIARPDDTLTIAGEGPERAALQRLAEDNGIADRVRFPGHLASIDSLLAEADALVLSSDYEGLPGVVIEALAAGLPILATDCCVSMADLVEHPGAGLLVPPGDEQAFAGGLVRIRDFAPDPERGRAIAARHEVEAAARRYVEVMTEVCLETQRNRARMLDPAPLSPRHPARRRQY